MIEKYGAKEVIGIDPEPLVIETANNLVLKKNLSDKANICTKPGEYKFKIKVLRQYLVKKHFYISIKNLLKEINEILANNGILAVGDWMRNDDNEPSEQMKNICRRRPRYVYVLIRKVRKSFKRNRF